MKPEQSIEFTDAEAQEMEDMPEFPCPFCDGGKYQPLSFGVAHSMVGKKVLCDRYNREDESSEDFLRACRTAN